MDHLHDHRVESDFSKSSSHDVSKASSDIDQTATLSPPPLQFKVENSEKEVAETSGEEKTSQLKSANGEGAENPADDSTVPNNTGLPNQLKSGIENLSGFSLDDVKVHRNSDKPAQLQAHAYAQGTNIHLGPGQEKHLPHEAWHVVQQKQGRVKPTAQLKAFNINDDAGLEKEADVMGSKAMQMKSSIDNTNLSYYTGNSAQIYQLVGINGTVETRFKRKKKIGDWNKRKAEFDAFPAKLNEAELQEGFLGSEIEKLHGQIKEFHDEYKTMIFDKDSKAKHFMASVEKMQNGIMEIEAWTTVQKLEAQRVSDERIEAARLKLEEETRVEKERLDTIEAEKVAEAIKVAKIEHDSSHTKREYTVKQVLKAAGFKGVTSISDYYGGRTIMIREGLNVHFTQFRDNCNDDDDFAADSNVDDIMDAVFGGFGKRSFHVTQELHGKKNPSENPHYYVTGEYSENKVSPGHMGKAKLQDELNSELARIRRMLCL